MIPRAATSGFLPTALIDEDATIPWLIADIPVSQTARPIQRAPIP